jgi:transposase-like protein
LGVQRPVCGEVGNSRRLWSSWLLRSAAAPRVALAWRSFRISKAKTLITFLKQNVAPGSTVDTDGLKSFHGSQEAGFQHVSRSQPLRIELRRGAKSVVPLADRAIRNLPQWLIGTYHSVSRDQLQVYLDEFVFRHNRRRQPMAAFQTLLGFGTGRQPTSYQQIRGASDFSSRHPTANLNLLRSAETTG